MTPELVDIQERVAHLLRAVDDLSEVVAQQQTEITHLTRQVETLMQRAAEREMLEGGSAPLADQKPPHW